MSTPRPGPSSATEVGDDRHGRGGRAARRDRSGRPRTRRRGFDHRAGRGVDRADRAAQSGLGRCSDDAPRPGAHGCCGSTYRNPGDPRRSTYGSSGGSAAAAARLVPHGARQQPRWFASPAADFPRAGARSTASASIRSSTSAKPHSAQATYRRGRAVVIAELADVGDQREDLHSSTGITPAGPNRRERCTLQGIGLRRTGGDAGTGPSTRRSGPVRLGGGQIGRGKHTGSDPALEPGASPLVRV